MSRESSATSSEVPSAADGFQPGLRLSGLDVGVLIVGGLSALLFGRSWPWFGVAIAFVVGHFFLFCNVIRMSRASELAWAAGFVALAVSTVGLDVLSWSTTFSVSLAATVALVINEMRKPSYHGVFWRRINPGLPRWWTARTTK